MKIVDKIKKICICIVVMSLVFAINVIYKIDTDNLECKTNDYSEQKYETIITDDTQEDVNLMLYSKSAVLTDAQTNRVLYSKNADIEMPMASTTKIMTCICALENCNEDDIVTFSKKASSQPQVKLGASENEQIKMKSLLYSLMLESHNDSAVAIAEHISGSVENFAELMNQKARDLGCYNTYFITPNGLDSSVTLKDNTVVVHHTTAAELARIMNYCTYYSPQKDKFLEITQTPSVTISDESGQKSYSLSNHNAALTLIEGAVSGKTGFTNDAGYCYVGTFTRNNKKLTVALLACGWPNNKTYKWKDAKTLIEYGDSKFNYGSADNISVDLPDNVNIYNCGCFSDDIKTSGITVDFSNDSESGRQQFLKSENEEEKVVYVLPKNIKGEVNKGEIIGTAQHLINGTVVATYPVRVTDSISECRFNDFVLELFKLLI